MRMIVFFDLPVKKQQERAIATRFRNFLLKDGFFMMQYSVYSRICNGTESVEKHMKRLMLNAPQGGSVRVLSVTEKQYASIVILSQKETVVERRNEAVQLSFF